ncbi:MAG: hypothetical protein AAGD12_11515 [Pseudomonadota bacterium]
MRFAFLAFAALLAACGGPRPSADPQRWASCEAGFDGPVVQGVTIDGKEVQRVALGPQVLKVNAIDSTPADGQVNFQPVQAPRVALGDTCNIAVLLRPGPDGMILINADRLRPDRQALVAGTGEPGVLRLPAQTWWMIELTPRERIEAERFITAAADRPEIDHEADLLLSFFPAALLFPLRE